MISALSRAPLRHVQGEMVNRIESNILQSSNYVEKAKTDVEQAVTYQKKARKVRVTVIFVGLYSASWLCL